MEGWYEEVSRMVEEGEERVVLGERGGEMRVEGDGRVVGMLLGKLVEKGDG